MTDSIASSDNVFTDELVVETGASSTSKDIIIPNSGSSTSLNIPGTSIELLNTNTRHCVGSIDEITSIDRETPISDFSGWFLFLNCLTYHTVYRFFAHQYKWQLGKFGHRRGS